MAEKDDERPFGFPFQPYSIQLQLMKAIYDSIEQRKVAILESPTGTGKSLSAICAALSWLEDDERRWRDECQQRTAELARLIKDANNDPDWMKAHKRKMEAEEEMEKVEEMVEKQRKIEQKLKSARQRQKMYRQEQHGKRKRKKQIENGEEEEQFERVAGIEGKEDEDLIPSDPEEDEALLGWKREEEEAGKEDEEPALLCRKVIYASRTHSQLEQFARELEKTGFKPRLLTVGSRQMLCVNESVKGLGNAGLVNDRCNELLSGVVKEGGGEKRTRRTDQNGEMLEATSLSSKKNGKSCGCEFARTDAIEDLTDAILLVNDQTASAGRQMRDIVNLGHQRRACPYFASRSALAMCQLVLVPYNILLHKGTRETWNLDLRDNVLIIDEAHNLLQTLASIHAVELNGTQLGLCSSLIHDYIERFQCRLSLRNLRNIRQLHSFTIAIHNFVNSEENGEEIVLTLSQFMEKLGVAADIDLYRLLTYLEQSKLCRKLRDFRIRHPLGGCKPKENVRPKSESGGRIGSLMERIKRHENKASEEPKNSPATQTLTAPTSSSPLYQLREFIEAITSPIEDARIVVNRNGKSDVQIRFLLLNPVERLKELISEARALLLLGGTMRPVDQLMDAFMRVCAVPQQRIHEFSCEHVIDDDQLITLQIGQGPDRRALNVQFANRTDPVLLSSLAQCLVNLLRHVPHGAVAFFPSFAFLSTFLLHLRSNGQLAQLQRIKPVFVEEKSGQEGGRVWDKFCDSARSSAGALLFAVVGGKLSEGINFSDELGRCVLMIGLPYPNKYSVELRERMRYLDTTVGSGAGSRFYEQLCLQAVNQAIGRAIRHRHDYAAIVLIDERYARAEVEVGMPGWIRRRLARTATFPEALQRLIAFFRARRKI